MADPIRWGIMGTARIATDATIPAIQAARNGVVQAIASRSRGRAQAVADDCGIASAYGSYEELLADPAVDAIYNPLPVSSHAEWSLRCAAAGKPCLCEKPLTTSRAEAERVRDAFAARGLLCTEVGMYRYHPLTRRVQELASTAIGTICALRSTFFVSIDDPADIRWQADCGGGAMRDLGCYCVGIMRLLAGAEPERVQAMADWRRGVDATMVGQLAFPGGAFGSFQCGLRSQFDCSYAVVGTSGRIQVDRGGMVPWPGESFTIRTWCGEDACVEEQVPVANHYQLMVEDVADAIRQGRAPLHRIEDAIANLAVIDDCLAAASCDLVEAR